MRNNVYEVWQFNRLFSPHCIGLAEQIGNFYKEWIQVVKTLLEGRASAAYEA
jgi:hypothetical protein